MKKLSFALVLLFSVLFLQSCQKDEINDPYAGREAPQLPSEKSFIMPFNDFDEGQTIKSLNNWVYSATNVLVWNTILTVNLAIPTLAFYESFNHQPVYQGQGVWLWSYEIRDNGNTYKAELYGELLASSEVQWDMYISKTGGFSQVHWYTGITANDQSYAHWTVNFNPENPQPFIGIDYQRDNGTGIESIRYTNIIPGVPENSSYIEYREGIDPNTGFDRAYEVYKAVTDNLLQINWDSENKNGRVKDPEKYQDQNWHCWRSDLHDTDC